MGAAHWQGLGSLGESVYVVVVDVLVDDVAVDGDADLALVDERPEDGRVDRLLDVGVRGDDVAVVAAEFQRGPREVLASRLGDAPPDRRRPRERDDVALGGGPRRRPRCPSRCR